MRNLDFDQLDFEKGEGLIPAIIQDGVTRKVLMLGYMNREALEKTCEEQRVTFFSRSKKRLWTKGETSGHFFQLQDITMDCDQDTLLLTVQPQGPACHTGDDTCFGEENTATNFLTQLEEIILDRKTANPESSYTSSLFKKGINKVAQKVGEEAVELVIEAKDNNKDLFIGEAADLIYHYLVLLAAKEYRLEEVIEELKRRHHRPV